MKTYILRFLLISFLVIGLERSLMAQSVRIHTVVSESGSEPMVLNPSDPQLLTPAYPVFNSTGNAAMDEVRFMEMVSRWNQYKPEHALTPAQIIALKNGQSKKTEESLTQGITDSYAYALLQKENLFRVWGHPGMPSVPTIQGENADQVYQTWLHEVKQWVASSESLQHLAKGIQKKVYPYALNPAADPDYPIYQDTGNPEEDDARYHALKLKYTEKLSAYTDK